MTLLRRGGDGVLCSHPPGKPLTPVPPRPPLVLSLHRFRLPPHGFSRAGSQRERSLAPPLGSWGHVLALDSCPPPFALSRRW